MTEVEREGDGAAWGQQRQPGARAHSATFLVREIGSLGRELDRAMGDHLSVNATDMRAMSMLLGRGPMTASELAAALGIGATTTSMVIDRLERLHHVTRERDTADRRRVVVRATPSSSTKARDALMPMFREIDALLDDMPEDARDAVQDYLQEVTATMRRHVQAIRADERTTP